MKFVASVLSLQLSILLILVIGDRLTLSLYFVLGYLAFATVTFSVGRKWVAYSKYTQMKYLAYAGGIMVGLVAIWEVLPSIMQQV